MIEIEGIPQIYQTAILLLALLIAIIGHEITHGYVAYHYGDSTAKSAGRLRINPLVHIDPIGSIVVPALLYFSSAPFLFAWAKPVPINAYTILKNAGYNGGIAVSLAGIAYNFTLAFIATIVLNFIQNNGIFNLLLTLFLMQLVIYNVILGVVNLWPIPPLDGSHALGLLCSKYNFHAIPRLFAYLGVYGMIIIVLILATPLLGFFFYPAKLILGFLL